MQELRSTEILDKEIEADARRKAETILKKADEECVQIMEGVKTKLDFSKKEKEEFYKTRLAAVEKDITASIPLEKQRFKVAFVQQRLMQAVNKYLAGLDENEKLELVTKDFDFNSCKDKELVAFVSNLLVEFDSGAEDIMDFASRYFPSESTQASIALFMKEVMDPFKKAIAYLVVNGIEEEYKGEGRVVAFAANGIYEQTESIIVNMIDEITESNLNEKDKDDCFLMLEGLAAALDTRDILMIRAIWCGLKKELEKNNLCKVQIGRMQEQMKLYLVLK